VTQDGIAVGLCPGPAKLVWVGESDLRFPIRASGVRMLGSKRPHEKGNALLALDSETLRSAFQCLGD
jgi:hypothetical protein